MPRVPGLSLTTRRSGFRRRDQTDMWSQMDHQCAFWVLGLGRNSRREFGSYCATWPQRHLALLPLPLEVCHFPIYHDPSMPCVAQGAVARS